MDAPLKEWVVKFLHGMDVRSLVYFTSIRIAR